MLIILYIKSLKKSTLGKYYQQWRDIGDVGTWWDVICRSDVPPQKAPIYRLI